MSLTRFSKREYHRRKVPELLRAPRQHFLSGAPFRRKNVQVEAALLALLRGGKPRRQAAAPAADPSRGVGNTGNMTKHRPCEHPTTRT